MNAIRVGFIGWRGMVGSVLMDRMKSEGGFEGLDPTFFSTSQVGQAPPKHGVDAPPLADAYDLKALSTMDVIVTCQGGAYTERIHDPLRAEGWTGDWIDAASTLRLRDDSIIVLDPVNRNAIDAAIDQGCHDFIGGNCTVSLMLMGLVGLFRQGWVEWVSTMTYQAASGAGAQALRELVSQMYELGVATKETLESQESSVLDLDKKVTQTLRGGALKCETFGAPLAASLLPWIDRAVENGQTREEWKGYAETNKILGLSPQVPIDGICVRVGAMRCHSQALTVKLTRDVPLDEVESALAEAHPWVRVVPNTKEATIQELTPAAISGTLDVPVGRIHKLRMGPEYLGLMTVGDQLLWGAAEPLYRILRILRERCA